MHLYEMSKEQKRRNLSRVISFILYRQSKTKNYYKYKLLLNRLVFLMPQLRGHKTNYILNEILMGGKMILLFFSLKNYKLINQSFCQWKSQACLCPRKETVKPKIDIRTFTHIRSNLWIVNKLPDLHVNDYIVLFIQILLPSTLMP